MVSYQPNSNPHKASTPESYDMTSYAEVDATDLFSPQTPEQENVGGSPDWVYCRDNAIFEHREACEFILWVPPDELGLLAQILLQMLEARCSANFITTYFHLADRGVRKICFYAG